ncbi:MAG: hypothetical protein H7Y22_08895 [Gemmatimonadaceae bacterium]|nr:hypothetical protein [Gloeobacterales cyanobacterium ES-bin-141]
MRRCTKAGSLSVAISILLAVPAVAQPAATPGAIPKAPTQPAPETQSSLPTVSDPPSAQQYRQLEQQNSTLSPAAADQMIKDAQVAAQSSKFDEAIAKTQKAWTMLNQMSTLHQQLSKAFAGIDNRIADEEKQLALQAAIKRDEVRYQQAVIHRAQGKPELAVPLLVQLVQSQNPTRDLGLKAYRQLFEIGFVKTQYPRQ